MSPINVGIIGCGNISGAYLKACRLFKILTIEAVADIDLERARARAAEYGVPKAYSVGDLLSDPGIDIVINLTVPSVHAEVSMAALEAGKSVYSEKPLATLREDGQELLKRAEARGLKVGCAPDTFLGGGLQTCRKAIDDGLIGRPIAATAFMMSHGPDHWHPDPAFFYKLGAGPMFDMGPYYLTALVNLMGPIRRVTGSAATTFSERVISSKPLAGTVMNVETPTHITGLLDFTSGAVGTIITSFDVWASELPRLEIYGTEGSLSAPDPNTFGGPVRVKGAKDKEWRELPLTHGYLENSRGIGVADMAYALRSGRPHRASGELAFHVLDTMVSVLEAAESERFMTLGSSSPRPAPLPLGLAEGVLDD